MPRSVVVTAAALAALLSACGGSSPPVETGHPTAPALAPDSQEERSESIDALGRSVWAHLNAGEPENLYIDEASLHMLLEDASTARVYVHREVFARENHHQSEIAEALGGAEYAGVCIQGARTEETSGAMGLVSEGWVFDRLLIIGRRPDGHRVAAWIEGRFIYSDAGWGAVDLERIERPRWEHSDLEIAPCDLSIRNDLPEPAR